MTDDILDIAQWKNKYPFLNNVWELYDKFNNDEYADTSRISYYGLCHTIISNVEGGNVQKHKDICMKLMRNLGHYEVRTKFFKPSHEHCHILYNWIYNKIQNSKTPNELIIECFKDYISTMLSMVNDYNCSYDAFNSIYLEPRKITILKIFYDNISNIIDKLNEEYSFTDSPSQNFVCECVKLYKEMYMKYCNDQYATNTERKQTCEMLNTFKRSYMDYIYNNIVKKHNVPSLENIEDEYIRKCQKNQDVSALTSSEFDSAQESVRLTRTVRGNPGDSRNSEAINVENQGNPMSSTVSTALGTVAGASSLLALLYKFTPGGNWIRSGIKGSRGRISSNLYEDRANELLFNGIESEDFSSYNQRYDVGYSPI